jgi:two-component system, OmpR family, KDP operon response regulator KdpE
MKTLTSGHGQRAVSGRRRILLCDADSQSLHALRVMLHRAGFDVDTTRTAAEALDRAALRLPMAAIVELLLPDGDGVEVCRRLREWSAMPVLVVSAACDEDVQVRAFEAGADDYVAKPFRPRELVARLRANLRRAEPGGEEPCLELDGLEIDLAARAVRREGDDVHLTPIEFKLLRVLAQNRGRLLTHDALLRQVWGAAYTDARQTLRAHIANLRRKIEPDDGERLIHTDHGVGYRLADAHPGARRGRPTETGSELRRFDRGAALDRALIGSAAAHAASSRYSARLSAPEQIRRMRLAGAAVTDYAFSDSNNPKHTYAAVDPLHRT